MIDHFYSDADSYSGAASQFVEYLLQNAGLSYGKAASLIGRNGKPLSRQSFFKMVKNGSIRLSVFLELIDSLGYELICRKK